MPSVSSTPRNDGISFVSAEGKPASHPGRHPSKARPARRILYAAKLQVLGLPALLVILGVMVFPTVYGILMSLSQVTISGRGISLHPAGLSNYSQILSDPGFLGAMGFTLAFAAVAVALEALIAVPIALLVASWKRAAPWLVALLLLPWSILAVANAELWAYLFNPSYGLVNWVLVHLHHSWGQVQWLGGKPLGSQAALMIQDLWRAVPFTVIMTLAGLRTIPESVVEAAHVDGATPWQIATRIKLPIASPFVFMAVMFRALTLLGMVAEPYIMTQGGPGTSTVTLSYYSYQEMFSDLNFGAGSASAVLNVLVGAVVVLIMLAAILRRLKALGTERLGS